jgi:hypothetical protein
VPVTIERKDLYDAGHWDWACLTAPCPAGIDPADDLPGGCFGGGIRPSDVDGVVERNGFFLYLEAKAPTAQVREDGQFKALKRRTEDGRSTVLIVWGLPISKASRCDECGRVAGENREAAQVFRVRRLYHDGRESDTRCDLATLRLMVRDWKEQADRKSFRKVGEQHVARVVAAWVQAVAATPAVAAAA